MASCAGYLAFKLGIETIQLIVVAAVLPSLFMINRTPIACCDYVMPDSQATASTAWILSRLYNVGTPVNALAQRGVAIAALLLFVGIAGLMFSAPFAGRVDGWRAG